VGEQWWLLAANAIEASDYYEYGLDRPHLPWSQKRDFIGGFDQWRWFELFNPPAYRFFTEDKVIFKRYMSAVGIPVPRLLGVIDPEGSAATGEPLRTDDDVRAWLKEGRIAHAVFKPRLGSHGTGVLIVGERAGEALEWHRVPAGRIALEEIVAHLHAFPHRRTFIVEERLRPHSELAELSPEVVHTARLVTMLDGDVEVITAALRIGAGMAPVDNFSQGNLAAAIDVSTGRLGPAVLSRARRLERVQRHPATGARIEGRTVPDWERALSLIRTAVRAAPFNPLLGWDVAFTRQGPVIIEANDLCGLYVSQIAPDLGLLATSLRRHLERRGAVAMIGLGLWRPPA
jgi:hypothetical protein